MSTARDQRTVHLTGYQDVLEVFRPKVRDATVQASFDHAGPVMDGVLLTLDGEEHHTRRRMEMPLFTPNVIRSYEEDVFPELTARALAAYGRRGDLDLVRIAHTITVQFAARLVGLSAWQSVDEAEAVFARLGTLNQAATVAHSRRDPGELLAEADAAREALDRENFRPAFDARLAELAAGRDLPTDELISLMIVKAEEGEDLSREQMLREAIFYVMAAEHTSATALVQAFDLVHKLFAAHPESRERSDDLVFLQDVVHESMRLHQPASPSFRRRLVCDLELSSGQTLQEGDVALLDLEQANRDPEVFGPDADEFRPGRECPRGVSGYGITFGVGAHACIGRDLAAGVVRRRANGEVERRPGSVARTLAAVLAWGAVPDPNRRPRPDDSTARDLYLAYPIVRAETRALGE